MVGYIGRSPQIGGYHKLDSITCDGSTAYTMQLDSANFTPESANHLIVSVNGVIQAPTDSFTVSGSTITFASALSSSDTIDFIMALGNVLDIGTPSDGTVTSSKISYPLTTFSSTGIDDNATSTAITIDSSENVGIGTTTPSRIFQVSAVDSQISALSSTNTGSSAVHFGDSDDDNVGQVNYQHSDNSMRFTVNASEKMRVHSNGVVGFGTTANSPLSPSETFGVTINDNISGGHYLGVICASSNGSASLFLNRGSDDGTLVSFRQANTQEGSISVSGSTISYNGFTGTHWSRLSDNSKPTILKGTILESLDEMMDWYQVQFDITETDDEGNETTKIAKQSYALGDGESVGDVITYNYEGTDYQATILKEGDVKHTKSKVSDTVDAKNVYGVFVDWDNDDDTVNDMYVAQTGTFVVRLNSSVTTLNKGDLIQSNGDGTGKVQSDDIIRSSTVAKVLSTTKIETYEDGSYIVPCSLHC